MWNGVPIYYSLGNFLFTHDSSQLDWYKGLVLEIEFNNGKLFPCLHPVKQSNGSFKLSLLTDDEKSEIEERVHKYSTIIADKILLNKEWNNYVADMSKSYLNHWSPIAFVKNRYISAVLRRLPIKLTNKKGLALYLNLMRCEAHRDMSKAIISKHL